LGIQVDFPRDRPICRLSIQSDVSEVSRVSGLYLFHIPVHSHLMASPVLDASILLKHAQFGHPGIALSKKMKIHPVSQDIANHAVKPKQFHVIFQQIYHVLLLLMKLLMLIQLR
jgi:hypothetical protein